MPLSSSKRIVTELAMSLTVLLLIVSTHELGHVAFGLAMGHQSDVTFISSEGFQTYGFATVFHDALSHDEVRFIALGGIAFNAITATLAYLFLKRTKNRIMRDFLYVLMVASILSVCLNALPIKPFDGSRFFQ